jgi:hypothetical protein
VGRRVVPGAEGREADVPGAPPLPSLTTEELLKVRAAGQGGRPPGEGNATGLSEAAGPPASTPSSAPPRGVS